MKKIKYNGHKYCGVVLCPMYNDTKFIKPQHQEFGKILIKTLVNEGVLTLRKNSTFKYQVTAFNNIYGCLTIRYDKRKLKFLFVKLPILYPTIEMVCKWNKQAQRLFEEDGTYGLYGLKDKDLIDYTLDYAENSIYYEVDQLPTVTEKAAYLWERIARFQAFQNGNKRTGLLTGLMFLGVNQFVWGTNKKNINNELYLMSKAIAVEKIGRNDLTRYIRQNISLDMRLMRATYDTLVDEKMI
ncbi:type II toxin-antitoxin system death-on-curing family toxin [Latilactobacillus sakei]|uniref:type II toxin-antitoxin system death-on-curing family toxin n=1 Tax=Latilactobacillus sakei TaxID=1599 RepID=UPI000DC64257|nr:Fic family protein [Latilactobacillus sakei]SPS04243.1 Fic/DOC family protein [Latilactobacillus sakei]